MSDINKQQKPQDDELNEDELEAVQGGTVGPLTTIYAPLPPDDGTDGMGGTGPYDPFGPLINR
jgi:bacteriocin-like protein